MPIPINFYTSETRFTPLGEKALQELAKVVEAEHVRTMKLVWHADQRGDAQSNMELSRRRVEAVRDALLQQGITAQIVIDWKGALQPFDINALP
jgi:OmpA-OmpF porin, OOP family